MPAAPRHRLVWKQARVVDVIAETVTARTLVLDVSGWLGHQAGQHLDIRLTAEDGYQTSRSYSLSSAPDEPPQITVEPVDEGEVSPFLADVVEIGDTFEIRGPIGGYFVWEPATQPLLLVGGGSGIAPLRSMWRAGTIDAPITVLYSARTADRLIFRNELATNDDLITRIHLTRENEPGLFSGRIEADVLAAVVDPDHPPDAFVCGPTAFVEAVATDLAPLLADSSLIRTERFG